MIYIVEDDAGQVQVTLAECIGGAAQHILHGTLQHLQFLLCILGKLNALGVDLFGGAQNIYRVIADAFKIADGVEQEEKVDKYEDALGTYLVKLSSPRTVSSSLDFAVTMMMGRRRRAGVLRSFFRMEKPSSPGSITSRMTSSGSAVRMACQKGSEVSAPSGSLP